MTWLREQDPLDCGSESEVKRKNVFSGNAGVKRVKKKEKVPEVMDSCDIKMQGNGLTADEILIIAAVLGEANIKSSDQYLAELKLMQLEMGSKEPSKEMLDHRSVQKRPTRRHLCGSLGDKVTSQGYAVCQ